VFVDRGWVPSPDARHVDQARYREPDSATVEGWESCPPRDILTLPFILQQTGTAAAQGCPGAGRRPPWTTDRTSHTPFSGSVSP